MKNYELHEVIELMIAKKVSKVKMGALEVELSPHAFENPALSTPLDTVGPEKEEIGLEAGRPTAEELMFWSTPYIPSIKAEPPNEE